MTDQQWRELDYLDSISATYQPAKYNPWEIFRPSKTLIQEKIKDFKQQCYEILKKKRNSEYQTFGLLLEQQHKSLLAKIFIYQNYLHPRPQRHNRGITETDKKIAKEIPIQNYYSGKLRRATLRLLGKCPFHSDKTASFVIYPSNTWYCFGACGEGGDSIKFIQKLNNLKFIEAVRFLLSL